MKTALFALSFFALTPLALHAQAVQGDTQQAGDKLSEDCETLRARFATVQSEPSAQALADDSAELLRLWRAYLAHLKLAFIVQGEHLEQAKAAQATINLELSRLAKEQYYDCPDLSRLIKAGIRDHAYLLLEGEQWHEWQEGKELGVPLPMTWLEFLKLSPEARQEQGFALKTLLLYRSICVSQDNRRLSDVSKKAIYQFSQQIPCPAVLRDLMRLDAEQDMNGRMSYHWRQALAQMARIFAIDAVSIHAYPELIKAYGVDLQTLLVEEKFPLGNAFDLYEAEFYTPAEAAQDCKELLNSKTALLELLKQVRDLASADEAALDVLTLLPKYQARQGISSLADEAIKKQLDEQFGQQLQEADMALQAELKRIHELDYAQSQRLKAVLFLLP